MGERPFREFLNRYLPTQPGPIMTPDGKKVGKHHGLAFYTLGQRKGLGIGGVKGHQDADGTAQAWYTARKDLEKNVLYVVQGHDHPGYCSTGLPLRMPAGLPAGPRLRGVWCKTRYRQSDAGCRLESVENGRFTLAFEQPQWAVTPGQSAVLYDGDICLGAALLRKALTCTQAACNQAVSLGTVVANEGRAIRRS
ncbi:hypothetical protein N7E01_01080 [Neopusillimonas aromaticivorans]|nr:tRNA methyl transferase PRC-barrel domain-containing protein [Neopusillimonas aromaticivorans]WJJ95120.1 hypothetical protein N7E01_01080 [Neopusillimonas aromaticivorans]